MTGQCAPKNNSRQFSQSRHSADGGKSGIFLLETNPGIRLIQGAESFVRNPDKMVLGFIAVSEILQPCGWKEVSGGSFGFWLRFRPVTGRFGHAPSISLAKTQNSPLPHGYIISSTALTYGFQRKRLSP
ncbi:MAG: hypothetical protein KGJ88_12860 [Verrucomicrobiota bacterium]|nr:hypothetical protein [Verrucomicrobiota bacterium]